VKDDHCPLVGLQSTESPLQLVSIGNRTGVVADRSLGRELSHLCRPAPQLTALICAGVDHQAMKPRVEPIRVTK
jgi:hypothetical protein